MPFLAQAVSQSDDQDDRLWHVAWSPDGQTLATCGAERVTRLWQQRPSPSGGGAEWHCVQTLEDYHSRTVRSCAFSPCGTKLCTASFDATAVIWEKHRSSGEWRTTATLEGHESEVKSVCWSASGMFLATCGRDKTVWVWEAPPDDRHAVAGSGSDAEDEDRVRVGGMNREDEDDAEAAGQNQWSCVSVLSGHEFDVKFVAFHPSEDVLVSCSYDDTLRIWSYSEDEADFELTCVLRGHENTVWGCVFLDANTLASCSQDLTCKIWKRGTTKSGDDNDDALASAPSPSTTWSLHYSFVPGHTRTIFSLDVLNGSWLVTAGGDNALALHRINANGVAEFVERLDNAHDQDVNCVRWNPRDAFLLATVGDDGKLKVWRLNADAFIT